jgi:hypothetical protein
MKKALLGIIVIAVLVAGTWYVFSGGSGGKPNKFGQSAGTTVRPIAEIQQNPEKYLNQVVTIDGTITRECPGSGCWWYVKDKTGEIRVDSKRGNFGLPLKQEGKTVRTTGVAVKTEGGELQIDATGAEFR